MTFSITPIGKVFQTYRTQERIAELNRQANLNTIQGQRDRVDISPEALELLAKVPPPQPELDITQPAEFPENSFSSPASAPPEEEFVPMFFDEE
jgi:hypothetical protein